MTPRTKTIATRLGYAGFGLFATLAFVYLTFPVEAAIGRINKELQKQAPGLSLAVGSASLYGLTGISATEPAITFLKGDAPTTITLDKATARLQILPLLQKNLDVAFELELGDSTASGVLGLRGEQRALVLNMDELDLGKLPISLLKNLPTRPRGSSSAEVDVAFDLADPKRSAGKGSIKLARAGLSEFKVMGFTIPAIDLGTLNLSFDVIDGTLKIKQFTQKGSDLEARVSGDISLKKQLAFSTLNLQVEVKLDEEFLKKNGTLRVAQGFGKKTADGFQSFKVSGTVSSPNAMP